MLAQQAQAVCFRSVRIVSSHGSRKTGSLGEGRPRYFLKEAAQDPYHVLFAVALTTGMRPSEYLALKWPQREF